MANNLYRGFSEKKWKERIYRAYRYSFSPTDTLWELFKPFLEAADNQNKHSEVARSYGKCWQCGYLGFDVEKHACTKTRGDI